jgi:hypothetical protein
LEKDRSEFLVFGIVILITRLPFLFYGYGSEEDAWGLIVTARNILQTGVYEVSRLPGHPLQEILLIPGHLIPAWALNFMTAVASTLGVVFFTKALKELDIPHYMLAGIALAFTPVFYIQSTNVMDYTWALSFGLMAFHQLINRKFLIAGIFIALATGFRITSAAMLLPLLYLNHSLLGNRPAGREALTLVLTVGIGSFIMFLPPLITYGLSFFTFYEYFPYPEVSKIFYKGVIGVWGVPAGIIMFIASVLLIKNMIRSWEKIGQRKRALAICSLIVMVLYTISFIRIPQKSAFIIPLLPWIYLLCVLFLNRKWIMTLSASLIISCFFFGLNLDHPLRGSNRSDQSVGININENHIVFDILYGPVVADMQKRTNKAEYADKVADKILESSQRILLIAGWYQNEIVYRTGAFESDRWKIIYYGDKAMLKEHRSKGFRIYYLPEQDVYNDIRFNGEFTEGIASPFGL